MSNMHIGKAAYNKKSKRIVLTVFYHVSITDGKPPGAKAYAPNTAPIEVTAISDGAIVEVAKTVKFELNAGKSTIRERLLAKWPAIQESVRESVKYEYALYGETL